MTVVWGNRTSLVALWQRSKVNREVMAPLNHKTRRFRADDQFLTNTFIRRILKSWLSFVQVCASPPPPLPHGPPQTAQWPPYSMGPRCPPPLVPLHLWTPTVGQRRWRSSVTRVPCRPVWGKVRLTNSPRTFVFPARSVWIKVWWVWIRTSSVAGSDGSFLSRFIFIDEFYLKPKLGSFISTFFI